MNSQNTLLKDLDQLLRGDKTRLLVQSGSTETLGLKTCLTGSVLLGLAYGLCMGLFAVMTRSPASWEQLLITGIKVPALFLLTLVVTFPSLYLFSALLGTRLRFLDVIRLLVAAITVNLCILAAFGPITAFFTISATSYPFMKLLNVAFFTIAGALGLTFLIRVMRLLEPPVSSAPAAQPGADHAVLLPRHGRLQYSPEFQRPRLPGGQSDGTTCPPPLL